MNLYELASTNPMLVIIVAVIIGVTIVNVVRSITGKCNCDDE
jgi:hypothetical protein